MTVKSQGWAAALAAVLLAGLSALAVEPDKKDLEYGPHGVGNRLDLYLPPKADAPTPLVIWIHGGGWEAGNKDNPPGLGLLKKGYALASINYRLSQEAKFPAQIEDCKAAIRFLRANAKKYNLDPDHFGVWGASAGGHLVALLGTTGGVKELEGDGPNKEESSAVQAVVDWFGPTDMLQMKAQAGRPTSNRCWTPTRPTARWATCSAGRSRTTRTSPSRPTPSTSSPRTRRRSSSSTATRTTSYRWPRARSWTRR